MVGKTIRLNAKPYTVIGVMPEKTPKTLPGINPDYWAPSMMTNHLNSRTNDLHEARNSHSLLVKGRLKDGVTLAQARAALNRVATKTHREFPDYSDDWGLTAIPTLDNAIHPLFDHFLFPAAGVLMTVVGMVLLIACVNLASFLLARATDRRKEIALRLALGARKWRLIRQLLTETAILGLAGGIAGFFLAAWSLRFIANLPLPTPVPLDLAMSPDSTVLIFTLGISLLAGILFGLVPAIQSTSPDIAPTLKNEAVLGRPPRRFNVRNVLVVMQVATSFLLLIGAGLFLRSLNAAQSADPGFGTEPTAIAWFQLSPEAYDNEKGRRYYRQVVDEVAALPGVKAVGLVDNLALGGTSFNNTVLNVPGIDPPAGRNGHFIDMVIIDSGYFDAAGVPILSGRPFVREEPREARVIIINQTMANMFWPGEDAVGKIVTDGDGDQIRVVGVARDTDVRRLGEEPRPYVYYSENQESRLALQVIARTSGNPTRLAADMSRVARRLDQDVMIIQQHTMDEHLGFMLFPFRLAGAMLAVFGGLTVLLASIGLYGVVSYAVAGRTREVGVRMSLGARGWQVVAMVMRAGMGLVAIGIAIGLALSLLATPVLQSLLFGVEATDPIAFSAVALLMFLLAAAASLWPALRASRVDPVHALRYE